MRIVEIKSQNVKIIYKPAVNQLKIGDFLSFAEGDLTLIAQVSKIVSSAVADDFNQADLFFVLTSKYNKISPWSGEIVSADASVQQTPKEILEKFMHIPSATTLFSVGKYLEYPNEEFAFNAEKFSAPILLGYEKLSDNEILVENICSQLAKNNKNFVLVDFYGNNNFKIGNKIRAGFQAKLPLNSDLLNNLSVKILEGVSLESKAVIENIILELAQYADENQLGFIPISQLIKVIEDIYNKSKISPLILLKNKLHKYKKMGIFADKKEEVYAVFNELSENNAIVFDLSHVPIEWKKEFLNSVLELNKKFKKEFYLLSNLDEQNFDNTMINNLLFRAANSGIKPILSSNYRYLSFETIFDFCKNIFLFKTYNALKKRPNIGEIIQSLPSASFLVTGHLTNGLLICAQNNPKEEKSIADTISVANIEQEELQAEQIAKQTNQITREISPDISSVAANFNSYETIEPPIKNIDMDVLNTAFKPEPSMSFSPEVDITPSIREKFIDTTQENISENNEPAQQENNITQTKEIAEISQTDNIIENNSDENYQEIEKAENNIDYPTQIQPTQNLFDDAIGEEIEQQEAREEIVQADTELEEKEEIFSEETEEQDILEEINAETVASGNIDMVEDIDLDDLDFLEETQPVMPDYNSSSDDELLDLLEDDDSILLEEASSFEDMDETENFEEEILTETKPQIPVYGADYDKSEKKEIPIFEEGSLVKHNKYGIGTVKKITKHGDKILCHINFEDFGRRLLDPEVSQLEKIQ